MAEAAALSKRTQEIDEARTVVNPSAIEFVALAGRSLSFRAILPIEIHIYKFFHDDPPEHAKARSLSLLTDLDQLTPSCGCVE